MFIRVVDSSSKPLNNLLRSLILKADFMDYLSLGAIQYITLFLDFCIYFDFILEIYIFTGEFGGVMRLEQA